MSRARSFRRVLYWGSGADQREAAPHPRFGIAVSRPHRTDRFRMPPQTHSGNLLDFWKPRPRSGGEGIGANSLGAITIRPTSHPVAWRVSLYRAPFDFAPPLWSSHRVSSRWAAEFRLGQRFFRSKLRIQSLGFTGLRGGFGIVGLAGSTFGRTSHPSTRR
jgi:hypothetical protein